MIPDPSAPTATDPETPLSTAVNGQHAPAATTTEKAAAPAGLRFERRFAHLPNPRDVEWSRRDVEIRDLKTGGMKFRQEGVEAPAAWSDLAVRVVASKFFYGEQGTPGRESSVLALVNRVVSTIADWGHDDGYFDGVASRDAFAADLTALCLHQHGSFNSPVWFNVGLSQAYGVKGSDASFRWEPDHWIEKVGKAAPCHDDYQYPQASACFIQSVADNMPSIMELARAEAMIFKRGSGSGTDLSTLRSRKEKLSGGGRPSGPLSFMRIYDAGGSVIQSGGRVRRAAKMQTLKVGHPDVVEFIEAKPAEDRKARALIAAGYSPEEAYASVLYQNSNLAVRATDEFLRRAEADDPAEWMTTGVLGGEYGTGLSASTILDRQAEGTWACGDPGMQYEDTIQRWHTTPNAGPINSSNPCSEYMSIDDSACNLASLNLLKFRLPDGMFDVPRFRVAVRIFITAQEILVDRASYPTDRICENAHQFRQLGLGFANLGAYLTASGLAYDSDEGRSLAGAITALMGGEAYCVSAEHAESRGAFAGFAANREPMLRVMYMHWSAAKAAQGNLLARLTKKNDPVWEVAVEAWFEAERVGRQHGYRNAQVTVLAPTGTIAFMMDCDTTGIEPESFLVKDKALAGGGNLRIVNGQVGPALRALGYGVVEDVGHGDVDRFDEVRSLLEHMERTGSLEGPYPPGQAELKPEHLPVFDCAYPARPGGRAIAWRAHLKMMAAVQPFLSGAISKTVGMPAAATVADIRGAYLEAWRLGLKAVAIYRDGSKGAQPLTAAGAKDAAPAPTPAPAESARIYAKAYRERLPHTRRSLTHKFDIGGHEGYVTVGFYPDGRPGEVFITMAKEGSTIGGLMDVLGTSISMGLQYGVPLDVFVAKFAHSRFEPAGFTRNPDIPIAKSLADYVFRWLGMEFIAGYRAANAPQRVEVEVEAAVAAPPCLDDPFDSPQPGDAQGDCPACPNCGGMTTRTGTCYRCGNCGESLGCS